MSAVYKTIATSLPSSAPFTCQICCCLCYTFQNQVSEFLYPGLSFGESVGRSVKICLKLAKGLKHRDSNVDLETKDVSKVE